MWLQVSLSRQVCSPFSSHKYQIAFLSSPCCRRVPLFHDETFTMIVQQLKYWSGCQ